MNRRSMCITLLLLIALVLPCAQAANEEIHWPEASGRRIDHDIDLTIDWSNEALGYVMAMAKPNPDRTRYQLQIVKQGYPTYFYDLNNVGEYEIIPLQLGAGQYEFKLIGVSKSGKLNKDGDFIHKVAQVDENAPFLVPNYYVSYDETMVELSDSICSGCITDEDKFMAVHDYVLENFTYDTVKAKWVQMNEIKNLMPDIAYLLKNRMGVCEDIAAFAACMLRIQGLPTKMVCGHVDDNSPHAWIEVYIDNEWQTEIDLTSEITGNMPSTYYPNDTRRYYY